MKAEINGVKMEGTPDEIATVVKLVGAVKATTTVTILPRVGAQPAPWAPQPWAPNVTWGGVNTRGPIAGTYVGYAPNGPSGYSAITFTTIAGGV